MALPKLNSPVFELTLPSSGETIKYRPFTVKEEKILLIAQQSGELKDVINSVVQIINNCMIDKLDVESLPMFDIEYIFLNLRSKSVSNITTVRLRDPQDEKTYDVEVNLDELEIKKDDNIKDTVEITDDIGVTLKYPSIRDMQTLNVNINDNTEVAYKLVQKCIKTIYDADNVYEASEYSDKELEEFIFSLSSPQFAKLQDFFNKSPKITKEVEYIKEDGTKKSVVLEGLNDFF